MAYWHGHSDPPELRLPRRLADDIAALYKAPVALPPRVDAQIAELGGAHCRESRVRRQIWFWGRVGAIVAALFVAIWAYRLWELPLTKPPPAQASPSTATSADRDE